MAKSEKRVKITLECQVCKRPELHHHEEQAERPRAPGDEEVLHASTASTPSTGEPVAEA
jgi:hypothetical protein